MKTKRKVIEVRCPKCGWPIVCKEGDRCYCGTVLHSKIVSIDSHPSFGK